MNISTSALLRALRFRLQAFTCNVLRCSKPNNADKNSDENADKSEDKNADKNEDKNADKNADKAKI